MNRDPTILNLERGRYRRQYDGFLKGRRINAVSWLAEAWFWRLNAIADDFGNFILDPLYLRSTAAPRRDITPAKAEALTKELQAENLIAFYENNGETYGHVVGFESLQPPPPNGRRVRKCPARPGESSGSGPSDLPGLTPVIPGVPGLEPVTALAAATAEHKHQHSDQQQHAHQPAPPLVQAQGLRSAAAALPPPVEWGDVHKLLRAVWPNGDKADELAVLPAVTPERVAWLIWRSRTDKPAPRRPQGFIEKGLRKGWPVDPAWLAKWHRQNGTAPERGAA